jgi:hypothetical protein
VIDECEKGKRNTKNKRIPAKEKCKRAMRITDGVF